MIDQNDSLKSEMVYQGSIAGGNKISESLVTWKLEEPFWAGLIHFSLDGPIYIGKLSIILWISSKLCELYSLFSFIAD